MSLSWNETALVIDIFVLIYCILKYKTDHEHSALMFPAALFVPFIVVTMIIDYNDIWWLVDEISKWLGIIIYGSFAICFIIMVIKSIIDHIEYKKLFIEESHK